MSIYITSRLQNTLEIEEGSENKVSYTVACTLGLFGRAPPQTDDNSLEIF